MRSRSDLSADRRLPPDVSTARGKLVCLYLSAVQRAGVREMSEALREPQLRLFPTLEYLVERGHVERERGKYELAGERSGER